MEKLYRSLDTVIAPQGRTITGTAIVFNQWSNDLGGFREIIRPQALTQSILDSSDIMANLDHKPDYVMARRKRGEGNLKLTLTERGLDFEFDCPETAKGEELLQHVRRGEYTACSFCFTLPTDGARWYQEDGELRSEVLKFDKIYDIAIVYTPAYEATSVSARSELMNKLCTLETEINNIYI